MAGRSPARGVRRAACSRCGRLLQCVNTRRMNALSSHPQCAFSPSRLLDCPRSPSWKSVPPASCLLPSASCILHSASCVLRHSPTSRRWHFPQLGDTVRGHGLAADLQLKKTRFLSFEYVVNFFVFFLFFFPRSHRSHLSNLSSLGFRDMPIAFHCILRSSRLDPYA